jgi:hypothetical protein
MQMDPSVASGGVDRNVPEQVGDGFELDAAAMEPRGQSVPQDMNPLVAQTCPNASPSHSGSEKA